MNKNEIISTITQSFPQLQNKLTLNKVLFWKKNNHAIFSFFSDDLIEEQEFFAIKKIVEDCFPKMKISIRMTSPSLGEAFVTDPAKYSRTIDAFLRRTFPAIVAWQAQMRWTNKDGAIHLEMPDDFSLQYVISKGVIAMVETAIKDLFDVSVRVHAVLRGDTQALIDFEATQRQQEDVEIAERTKRIAAMNQDKKTKSERKKGDGQQIKGRAIAEPPVEIVELTAESGIVVIQGEVLSDIEVKEISGGEAMLLSFSVTDYTDTIRCKSFLYYRQRNLRKEEKENAPPLTDEEKAAVTDVIKAIKGGNGIKIRGNCQYDTYAKENVVMVRDMMHVPLLQRMDEAEVKRVELHMHSNMSNMDAVTSAKKLISRAAQWGHPAVAITDHGVVQAFPEAFFAAKMNKIKLIPGMEGYLINDESVVINATSAPLDETIVVLDFETTGLQPTKDRVIEIGAVKLFQGSIVDSFGMLVNPGISLPKKIVEITNITDQMLRNAPKAEEAIPQLMAFMGDCPISAHNAKFDIAFLNAELARLGMAHTVPVLDTLVLSRKILPELKTFRLQSVCKRLGVSLKGAHRAVNDAEATAKCLGRMIQMAKDKGAETLEDLNHVTKGHTIGNSYHIILLAKNQKGMQNLNQIVSLSHQKYFRKRPHVPKAVLQKYREGLIIGSACEAGELFQAIVAGEKDENLRKIARFYDYLEIQPIANNQFMLKKGLAKDEEELRNFNRKIVELGEKIGLPVVATCDVHFLDPKDSIFRSILQAGQGFRDADDQPPLYLRTTDEMLEEFAYLGKEKAYEVVVTNTNLIADRIEEVTLFPKHPENKTTFSPYWDTAENDIRDMTWNRAHDMYGDELPEVIVLRLEKELNSIIGYGYATLYSIANKLVTKSLQDGYLVGSRGSVGSSLVATMCDITEVNPLPPHYRCAKCRRADFDIPKQYTIGVDLPDKNCPVCGEALVKEGFDIPFEVFLGFKGDKVPDIDLNFSGEYQSKAHKYVEELFGEQYVFRAGTIGTLAEKTAFGYVMKYLEERNMSVSDAEKKRLAAGCVGVKRTTGQHPGGMVVLPQEYDICQFTAVQHPADDLESGIFTTHYDFGSMHDILVKLDILGHDDPTMIHRLEELSGVHYLDIPLDDKKVMSLFSSPEALGVTSEEIGCATGTFGVPEFGTAFVRQMLIDTKPTTMQELIRISGLSHGTDVWLGNAKDLIDQGIAPLSLCLCTRDDIMNQLIEMGVDFKMAFDTMENVRKGKGLTPPMEQAMEEHEVPQWFVDSCKKIKYMFPKGHAVAYVTMALRIAWYKVHHPLCYYAAYFSIRASGFDACTMLAPIDQMKSKLEFLVQMDSEKKLTAKEKEAITCVELVIEMLARGFTFLPADLYKSDAECFLPEGEQQLRVPFSSLAGLGDAAARGIAEARKIPFISIEDLKNRAKLSSAVIQMLREQGALDSLDETSQISLF